MKRTKTLELTRRQVALIRCLLYPRLRVNQDKDLSTVLHKLERLWKEPLYTGTGERYHTWVPCKTKPRS